MTPPLSQEQRVELVAKAKAATPGPWAFECGDHSHRYSQVIAESERTIHYKYGSGTAKAADQDERDAAFIAAANPDTILAYEATVVALEAAAKGWEDANRVNVIKLAAALERVKALEAGAKPFIDAALQIPAEVEDFKVIAHVPGGHLTAPFKRMAEYLTAGNFRALLTTKDPGQ